jgi:hypothetical protein
MEEVVKPSKRVIRRTKKNKNKLTRLEITLIIVNALLTLWIILK